MMHTRRRHPRYRLTTPLEGTLRLLEAVTVTAAEGDVLRLTCPRPVVAGEILDLKICEPDALVHLRVKVLETALRRSGDDLHHDVRVVVLGGADEHAAGAVPPDPPETSGAA